MPVFDPIRRCLIVRLVYDGPAFGGKTTNLRQICELFPITKRTEMYTPGALKGRTMFFDWVELEAGRVGAQQLRCQLLTVPGQGERSYRRRPLLEGADGVVFVADSQVERMEANIESLDNLRINLKEQGYDLDKIPFVMQYNKRDLPNAVPVEELRKVLNPRNVTERQAVAPTGVGVFDTLKDVAKLVLTELKRGAGGSQ